MLEGALNSVWKYVLKEHFPEPMDDSTGVLSPESNNRNSKESFQKAIELFLQHSTHEKKLRDCQLIYYQPGGNERTSEHQRLSIAIASMSYST